MKSSNRIVPLPCRSNFRNKTFTKLSERRQPNACSAFRSSSRSMLPELSVSNERKQFCQSVTYFHSAPKSWKLTWPRFSRSNIPATGHRERGSSSGAQVGKIERKSKLSGQFSVQHGLHLERSWLKFILRAIARITISIDLPIIRRTVSGLKAVHVPFDRACCSSSAEMYPLRSLSTLGAKKSERKDENQGKSKQR